jgi:hypothetical protein
MRAPPTIPQVGGSIIFIFAYWLRRWTGRDKRADERAAAAAAAAAGVGGGHPLGSVKSYYSSDPTGSEVEIAIQPGSARYAGGQMHVPQSGEGWGGGLARARARLPRALPPFDSHACWRGGSAAPHPCLPPSLVPAEPLTDESYSPRSDASPSPVRRRRGDSPFAK